jgi:hypothetical protein
VPPPPAAPLLPELAPDDEPAGRSGGGGDVIEGEVGETLALFSLPGPTLPGFAVTPDVLALFAGGLGSSAKAGPTANSATAAMAMQTGFIRRLLLVFGEQRTRTARCSRNNDLVLCRLLELSLALALRSTYVRNHGAANRKR